MDRVRAIQKDAGGRAPGSPAARGTPEHYQVLAEVGHGAFGTCKKVKRKVDGKILLWKEVSYGSRTDYEKKLLITEVNILRELEHPHIVRYYENIDDRTKSMIYIVMEYCEGGDLATLIRKRASERRNLSEDFVLRVFAQLISALQVCHKRKGGIVLHRDLKPANIFLDSKQNVKLGDFGIARILQQDSYAKTFIGTPYYMSPEQMNCKLYNEKSDIWSLGCVVYELCALTPPFKGSTLVSLAERIKEGKFTRIPWSFSDELQSIITKMLNLSDCLRPSVDSLLQNALLACYVADKKRAPEKRGMVPEKGPNSEHRRAAEKRVDHAHCRCREHSPCLSPDPVHAVQERLRKLGECICDVHKQLKTPEVARYCQSPDTAVKEKVRQLNHCLCAAHQKYQDLLKREQQLKEQQYLKLGVSPLRKLNYN